MPPAPAAAGSWFHPSAAAPAVLPPRPQDDDLAIKSPLRGAAFFAAVHAANAGGNADARASVSAPPMPEAVDYSDDDYDEPPPPPLV